MDPQKSRNRTSINRTRWLAYAAAAAASAYGGTRVADADVFYSGILNIDFSGTERSGFSIGSAASFALIHSGTGGAFFQIQMFAPSFANESFAGMSAGPFGSRRYVDKLQSNVFISSQKFVQQFSSGPGLGRLARYGSNPNSQWLSPGTGFIGFKFNIGGPGGPQYGWARITMTTGSPDHNFRLIDYAFASPGEALRTGQTKDIPEPGSLGLLALGGAGLLAWRQRRAKVLAR